MTWQGGRRRWQRRLLLALTSLLAIGLLVPVERYRVCVGDRWNCLYLEGPRRTEYADLLSRAMTREGFFHIRIGNTIFVRLAYPLHAFAPAPAFHSLGDFLNNTEHKIGNSMLAGDGTNGRYELPALLRAILDERRTQFGREIAGRDEKREWDPLYFSFDFEVFCATFIQIEDMNPDQRLHFVPTSPRPAKCDLSGLRAWSSRCGMIVRGTGDRAVIVRKAKEN